METMAERIVVGNRGEGGCTVSKVYDELYGTAVTSRLSEFALRLGLSWEATNTMEERLLVRSSEKSTALYGILMKWKSQNGSKATLETLLVALEKLELNDCSEKLSNAFLRGQREGELPSLGERIVAALPILVFISYRVSSGSVAARWLKEKLDKKGFRTFLDIDRDDGLQAGNFNQSLMERIKQAPNFILLLTPNSLDRCIGDNNCTDFVHKEVVTALNAKRNIIPVIMWNFEWPNRNDLPEDMRPLLDFHGVRWLRENPNQCVRTLVSPGFLKRTCKKEETSLFSYSAMLLILLCFLYFNIYYV